MTPSSPLGIHVSDKELLTLSRILQSVLTDEAVFVFGSRARGDHRATSDIDLAIIGPCPMSIATRSQLEFAFSESGLPFKVDIVDLSTTDDLFKNIIQAEAVPLKYK